MGFTSVYQRYKRIHRVIRLARAPLPVRRVFRRDIFNWYRNKNVRRVYVSDWEQRLDDGGRFTTRWTDGHLYNQDVAYREAFGQKPVRSILEIGSWEGRSTRFLLSRFPESTLIAVDTWEGSDEHQENSALSEIEERFDHNTSMFSGRVQKFQGRSIDFFSQAPGDKQFDLAYVDGSHFGDDVLVDAVESFRRTRVGGVIVFDDFTWNYYERPGDNVGIPLIRFLQIKKDQICVLSVTDQLIIQKCADS